MCNKLYCVRSFTMYECGRQPCVILKTRFNLVTNWYVTPHRYLPAKDSLHVYEMQNQLAYMLYVSVPLVKWLPKKIHLCGLVLLVRFSEVTTT
jgi:hypothetical protein